MLSGAESFLDQVVYALAAPLRSAPRNLNRKRGEEEEEKEVISETKSKTKTRKRARPGGVAFAAGTDFAGGCVGGHGGRGPEAGSGYGSGYVRGPSHARKKARAAAISRSDAVYRCSSSASTAVEAVGLKAVTNVGRSAGAPAASTGAHVVTNAEASAGVLIAASTGANVVASKVALTAAAAAATGTPATPGAKMLAGHERAMMPRQPTERQNACWVGPVVALAKFYRVTQLHGFQADTKVTIASVLALQNGDDDEEEVIELFEQVSGAIVETPSVWSNDADFFKDADSVEDERGAASCRWMGPTSEVIDGVHSVCGEWFDDVRKTIDGGNPVLLLLERLGSGKDQGNLHYLLCLGYEETVERRNRRSYTLHVKDPMEGDVLLAATLWEIPVGDEPVELTTRQSSGARLDQYSILESTHLHTVSIGTASSSRRTFTRFRRDD